MGEEKRVKGLRKSRPKGLRRTAGRAEGEAKGKGPPTLPLADSHLQP